MDNSSRGGGKREKSFDQLMMMEERQLAGKGKEEDQRAPSRPPPAVFSLDEEPEEEEEEEKSFTADNTNGDVDNNNTMSVNMMTNKMGHRESDHLVENAVPCGQYRSLGQQNPIVAMAATGGEQGEEELDIGGGGVMQQQQQREAEGGKRRRRNKRTRYTSQGSNPTGGAIGLASGGGRRSTFLGGRMRRGNRRRRRHIEGPNAPPRHVHFNDWREMLEITRERDRTDNEAMLGAQPAHKSEQDLSRAHAMMLMGEEEEGLETVEAVDVRGGSFPNVESLNELAAAAAAQPPTGAAVADSAAGVSFRDREVARMRYVSGGSSLQCDWIEQTFHKRECIQFIPSSRDQDKCGCGRYRSQHALADYSNLAEKWGGATEQTTGAADKRWSMQRHTMMMPTDAYGTIEFQGGAHPFKAQYLRLAFDSDPADIMCLFEHVWEMEPPKLIITIHGGITNFDLQPKLARVFRKGLLKAARTTGAWIFTSGINAGVVRQVAAALESAIPTAKCPPKIVSVGIAPWGVLRRREDFIGRDKVLAYHPQSFPPKSRFAVLNNRHSFFLLVDNGTLGRYGAEIILRRRLESYIAEKQKIGGCARSVPVVCVVLEGGTCTIRTVLDHVTTIPKVPVVICDGSGRASDLIAFAHQYIQDDGNLPEGIRPQLLSLIEDVFDCDKHNAQCLVMDILACVRQRNLITVFRLGESHQKQDVDYAILTALLKGHNLTAPEQLSLALAWNRVDIARSDIFVMGQDWPKAALHNAMMDALIHNRVDFVRLLLENGVSMHEFLTIARLEELYNTDQGPPNTLYYIVRDVVKIRAGYRYKLPHIGMAIEKLMANGFRSHYASAHFQRKYSEYKKKLKESQRRLHQHHSSAEERSSSNNSSNNSEDQAHQQQQQQHYHLLHSPPPMPYHRCGSEFFSSSSRAGARTLPSSASDTRLFSGTTTAQNAPQQGQQQQQGESGAFQHQMPTQQSSFAGLSAISGNRALSNHILWRTAFRRGDNNPMASGSNISVANKNVNSNQQHQPQQQTTFLSAEAMMREPIGYAAEADESMNNGQQGEKEGVGQQQQPPDFRYPFSDLLVWAVLTKRHEMAICMWQHGEEAMAKALVACRLYKSLANEAAEDYLEVEVCEELKKYAEEFRQLSLDLLDHCYKQDDAQTLQLLTYELYYWGRETCLSLAVIVNNKQFLAHPCCQILLADLWHGGLRIRSNSNLKVILGILFPPSIFLLEFKSREELMQQPQTAAEHQDDINDTSSSSSESSSSSSSSSSSAESESEDERAGDRNNNNNNIGAGAGQQQDESDAEKGGGGGLTMADRRKTSHGSQQSLNFTSLFQSKRKRRRASQVAASNIGHQQHREDIEMGRTSSSKRSGGVGGLPADPGASSGSKSAPTALAAATATTANREQQRMTKRQQQQQQTRATGEGEGEDAARMATKAAKRSRSSGNRPSALALAAKSTLGAATAVGTGGSPLLPAAGRPSSPLTSSSASSDQQLLSCPAPLATSAPAAVAIAKQQPMMMPSAQPIYSLQINTSLMPADNQMKGSRKDKIMMLQKAHKSAAGSGGGAGGIVPHFTLGSIGENADNADGEEEEGEEERHSGSAAGAAGQAMMEQLTSPATNHDGKWRNGDDARIGVAAADAEYAPGSPPSWVSSPCQNEQQHQLHPLPQRQSQSSTASPPIAIVHQRLQPPIPPPPLAAHVESPPIGPPFFAPPHWRQQQNKGMGLASAVDHLSKLAVVGTDHHHLRVPKGIPLPEGVTLNKKRQIKFRRKLYEFFVAPITTFWAWTLSFLVFLSILTYVLLIRTPLRPTILEWYLLAYVLAFGLEIMRKFIMSEPTKMKEKVEYFFGNYWNFLTTVAVIGFVIGFAFRMIPSTSKNVGRVILAVDSVLWSIKLLDFLGVFPRFGPYITMAGKMIMNMSSIVVMLGISLLGFGLARQSITYPNEDWHWLLLRNVFYKPYFMLYGEVYADEIDTCGDEAWDEHLDKNVSIANAWTHRDDRERELACVPGHWIPPILMTLFLLVANILLISMLIAIFNNIFESTNKISHQIWLFQRYRQVMEYEATPFLPPPFTPVYHVYMVFKYLNYYSHKRPCFQCLTTPAMRSATHCFACCFGRRRKGSDPKGGGGGPKGEDIKGSKMLPVVNNAFEQRRNLGSGGWGWKSNGQQERAFLLFDFSLKLFLTDDQVEKLHDFEEECMEEMTREKEYERTRSNEERLHRTCERTEMILLRVNDLSSKETMLKGNVREMESRLELIEGRQTEMLDCLRQITSALPAFFQNIQTLQQLQQQMQQQQQPSPSFPPPPHPHGGGGSTAAAGGVHQIQRREKGEEEEGEQDGYVDDTAREMLLPKGQSRMGTARSEGHIYGAKGGRRRRSMSGKQGKEIKTLVDDLSSSLKKQQLMPSVSVDACAPSTTQTAMDSASAAATAAMHHHHHHRLVPPSARSLRAQSCASALEKEGLLHSSSAGGGGGGASSSSASVGGAGSSMSTVYYPLKGAGSGNVLAAVAVASDMSAQRRKRTTTLAADDLPHIRGVHNRNSQGSELLSCQNQRLFGSLVSLDPSTIISPTLQHQQKTLSTRRRHRQNDEYTSITDTINVELEFEISKTSSVTTTAAAAFPTTKLNTVDNDDEEEEEEREEEEDEDEEEEGEEDQEEKALNRRQQQYLRRERALDPGMHTEDDEEEDYEEEDDEAEDEEYEEDERAEHGEQQQQMSSSNISRRRAAKTGGRDHRKGSLMGEQK